LRFTLRNARDGMTVRVEMMPDEDASELGCIAREFWGRQDIALRNGYYLVREGCRIGDFVKDGDTVDMITDPRLPLVL
jgi:hypothetical protein